MVPDHEWELFTEGEDTTLLELHARYGNQWKKIGELSGLSRDRSEVKNRVRFLLQSQKNDEYLAKAEADVASAMMEMPSRDPISEVPDCGVQSFSVILGMFLDHSCQMLARLSYAQTLATSNRPPVD